MSIPAIQTTSTAVRARAVAVDNVASTTAVARSSSSTAEADTSEKTEQPATVHFPWVSRLSQQLEAASNKRPTYANPIMGDNLDKKA